MLVCEVVTGKSYSTTRRRPHCDEPPLGYDSVKAEGATEDTPSQFKVRLPYLTIVSKYFRELTIIKNV